MITHDYSIKASLFFFKQGGPSQGCWVLIQHVPSARLISACMTSPRFLALLFTAVRSRVIVGVILIQIGVSV